MQQVNLMDVIEILEAESKRMRVSAAYNRVQERKWKKLDMGTLANWYAGRADAQKQNAWVTKEIMILKVQMLGDVA